jgi:hypothetical protein
MSVCVCVCTQGTQAHTLSMAGWALLLLPLWSRYVPKVLCVMQARQSGCADMHRKGA